MALKCPLSLLEPFPPNEPGDIVQAPDFMATRRSYKRHFLRLGIVMHVCNPSYSGEWGRRITRQKPETLAEK
jgi:hypothetical protein